MLKKIKAPITKPITEKAETKTLLAPVKHATYGQVKWGFYRIKNLEPKGILASMYF